MSVINEKAARQEYSKALKIAQREVSARSSRGERATLKVLDEITNQAKAMAYIQRPQREIPLNRVVGTYTATRARSFSASFLPLHAEGSEFASKWISVCAAHLEEGLRDPINVYEYLWDYYVIEGNKRVSVLKYFDAPTIRADITRLIPQLSEDDKLIEVYYAYLGYEKKGGKICNIQLSTADKYQQLLELEAKISESVSEKDELNFNSLFMQFDIAYQKTEQSIHLGDAFLEYLKVYSLETKANLSEVVERVKALEPQLILQENLPAEPTLVLDKVDEPASNFITRLFGQKRTANVVFAYAKPIHQDPWVQAHEQGRLKMQQALEDRVHSSYIENLNEENVYDALCQNAENADLLLITSQNLGMPSLRFALEHPNCLMLVCSRVKQDFRLSTYWGRYYEAVFLCGAMAGMTTITNKVAYITPHLDYKRHTSDVNAFALGVKSVRPEADVLLVWRDVVPNSPETCCLGLKNAANEGCDIAYTPRIESIDFQIPEGIFSFLAKINKAGVAYEYLAAPMWDWGRFYSEMVKSYLNGSLDILRLIDRGDPSVAGLWWGIGTGILRFEMSGEMYPIACNLLHFLRSQIAQGHFDPFHGPIYDQNKALRAEPDSVLKPMEVLQMDWLCDFIRIIE